MYQNFIITYLYEAQRVSGDTTPVIRSPKLHWQPLVLHTRKVVGRVVGGHIRHTVPDMSTNYMSNNLPRMKNQRLPVQFWAPDDGRCVARNTLSFFYKYVIIKFWYIVASCWISLYELLLLWLCNWILLLKYCSCWKHESKILSICYELFFNG